MRGKQLQQNIAETRRELRDFACGVMGNIRLGCSASMADHLLPHLTATLLSHAPAITLNLVIGQDNFQDESLCSGRLDMVICLKYETGPLLESHALCDAEAMVVASQNHPLFNAPISCVTCSVPMGADCDYRFSPTMDR